MSASHYVSRRPCSTERGLGSRDDVGGLLLEGRCAEEAGSLAGASWPGLTSSLHREPEQKFPAKGEAGILLSSRQRQVKTGIGDQVVSIIIA